MIPKMSEMFHPPVGSFEKNVDLVRPFAETMHTVIANYGKHWAVAGEADEQSHDEIVTERFDIEHQDGTIISVRLRVMDQHFANIEAMVADGTIAHKSTGRADCVGLVLEYAEYSQLQIDEYGENLDDLIKWQSYVFVGIEVTPEAIDATILNAQNGKELSRDDLLSAYNVLLALKSNLEAEEFASAMAVHYEIDVAPLNEPLPTLSFHQKYADTFSDIYIDSRYCEPCGRPTVYCEHAVDIRN